MFRCVSKSCCCLINLMETRSQSTKGDLTDPDIKQFLRDVENAGGLSVDFKALCDLNPVFYGIKGSSRRRKFQRRFYKQAEKSAKNYLEYLTNLGVSASDSTRAAAQSEEKKSEEKPSKPSEENPSEEKSEAKLTSNKSRAPTSPVSSMSDRSSDGVEDITVGVESIAFTPPRTGSKKYRNKSMSINIDGSNKTDIGMATNPQLLWVNRDDPTRSYPFVAKRNIQHMHNTNTYNTWQLEYVHNVLDYNTILAYIPKMTDPKLTNRVVAFEVPVFSKSQTAKDTRKVIQDVVGYANGKADDETLLAGVAADADRKTFHYLLIFPEGTLLDNEIFSPGRQTIQKHPITPPIMLDAYEEDDEDSASEDEFQSADEESESESEDEGKDGETGENDKKSLKLPSISVWMIAEKGGIQTQDETKVDHVATPKRRKKKKTSRRR